MFCLTRYYPRFAQSKLARFEFYMNNWPHTFNQLIDQELILADSEGKELKVSDGDVRDTPRAFWPQCHGLFR